MVTQVIPTEWKERGVPKWGARFKVGVYFRLEKKLIERKGRARQDPRVRVVSPRREGRTGKKKGSPLENGPMNGKMNERKGMKG